VSASAARGCTLTSLLAGDCAGGAGPSAGASGGGAGAPPPADAAAVAGVAAAAAARARTVVPVTLGRDGGGAPRRARLQLSPLYDHSGHVSGFLGVVSPQEAPGSN
jgi:hypothetical protein